MVKLSDRQAGNQENRLAKNEPPLDFFNDLISLTSPVVFDNAGWSKTFGQVLLEPPDSAYSGETVTATFVGANPRNNLQHESSYLTVERRDGNSWTVVATDASWETRFKWTRTSSVFGTSEVDVIWTVPPHSTPGTHRIRYFGHFKYLSGKIEPFVGTSKNFQVVRKG